MTIKIGDTVRLKGKAYTLGRVSGSVDGVLKVNDRGPGGAFLGYYADDALEVVPPIALGDYVRFKGTDMPIGKVISLGAQYSYGPDRRLEIQTETGRFCYYPEDLEVVPAYTPPEAPKDDLESLAAELGKLVASKQAQYGDSVGKSARILETLYPDGIPVKAYADALLVVRILDKLSRLAQRGEDGKDLGGESPYRDIAGYGLLGLRKDEAE